MMKLLLAATALTLAVPAAAQAVRDHGASQPTLTAALTDAKRPQADRDRDPARKPAELLALLELKPGAKVGDFVMGGGYWSRILAGAVGPTGKVYAYQPGEFLQFGDYAKARAELETGYPNVKASSEPFAGYTVPEQLDAILTVQNWHDMHWTKIAPATTGPAVARALFNALKPGGVLVVVDHSGSNAGGAFSDAGTLHRGDAAATKAELTAAGFELAAESPLYANPADPKTANVFDPAIRGKTDQFVLKFVKPR